MKGSVKTSYYNLGFENHVSFKGYQATAFKARTSVMFENHVSFKGYQAIARYSRCGGMFENHVSFKGYQAVVGCAVYGEHV